MSNKFKRQQIEVHSWKDLLQFKKSKDIIYEDEVLFTITELSASDFQEFWNLVFNKDNLDNYNRNKNILNIILINNDETIAFLLKRMCKGKYADFSELSDVEIVEILNNLSPTIIQQINEALDEFVSKRISDKVKELRRLTEQLKESGVNLDLSDEVVDSIVKSDSGTEN